MSAALAAEGWFSGPFPSTRPFFRSLFSRAGTTAGKTRASALARFAIVASLALLGAAIHGNAQNPVTPSQLGEAIPAPTTTSAPIAIVPIDANASVTGALEVTSGRAIIATTGSITAGARATEAILPHRGTLRVCASTTVKIAANTNAPAGDTPGLMMALDHGAIEASFATARDADVLLTPDFRITIGAPGSADLKIRLGQHGDTCVDNAGDKAPSVVVTSVFDGADYRVQPGQRVMFQHGSLQEVVDNEKEPCGCPPDPRPGTNDFPLDQSAGLSPHAPPLAAPPGASPSAVQPAISQPLVYQARTATADPAQPTPSAAPPPMQTPAAPAPVARKQPPGFFHRIGAFFRKIFGAE